MEVKQKGGISYMMQAGSKLAMSHKYRQVTPEEYDKLEARLSRPMEEVDAETLGKISEAVTKITMTKKGYPLKLLKETIEAVEPDYTVVSSNLTFKEDSVGFTAIVKSKAPSIENRRIEYYTKQDDYSFSDVEKFLSLLIQNIRKMKIIDEIGDYVCLVPITKNKKQKTIDLQINQ